MYTNKQMLKIKNLNERGAAIKILAAISKLKEKQKIQTGISICLSAKSQRLTAHTERFLKNVLKSEFENIYIRFENSEIVVILTPK